MALAMPIQNPPVPPAAIRNRPANTDVPLSLLENIDRDGANPYYMMAAGAPARAMRALHRAAAAAGIVLSTTGRTRTYQQQVTLFLSRHTVVSYSVYVNLPATGGYRRVWDGKYWKLNAGMAAAAPPSYSAPHVTGCCDDLAELIGGKVVSLRASTIQWLYANAPAFGFMWSLPSEPWHVQYVLGDTVPAAVLALEGAAAGAVATVSATSSSAPNPTQEETDVTLRIFSAMPDPDKPDQAHLFSQEFYAVFYGVCDAEGRCLGELQWSGPGDDPAAMARLNVYRSVWGNGPGLFGSWPLELAGCRMNALHPKNRPEDIADGRMPGGRWSRDNFAV